VRSSSPQISLLSEHGRPHVLVTFSSHAMQRTSV